MADIFLQEDAKRFFRGKKVIFLGSSVMRNIYQDFLYLLEKGELTPNSLLKKKGVQIQSFVGDQLVAGTGELMRGRNYREIREYRGSKGSMANFMYATYVFLTKCFSRELEDFIVSFEKKHGSPDLILILSSLWDINRWGPDGVPNYIQNCRKVLGLVKKTFSSSKTQLIWLTSPPIFSDIYGGFMVEGLEFAKRSMRFNVMEGNNMVAHTTAAFGFDVVDLHYWMTHQIHKRMPDGVHWSQEAVRLQLNIILTHFCLSRNLPLPGRSSGTRNKALESATKIAKVADDEDFMEIVKEEVGKRKCSDEIDPLEPPAKKVRTKVVEEDEKAYPWYEKLEEGEGSDEVDMEHSIWEDY